MVLNNNLNVIRGMSEKKGPAARLDDQASKDAKSLNQETKSLIAGNNLTQRFAEAMNLYKLVQQLSSALTRNGKEIASGNLQAIA